MHRADCALAKCIRYCVETAKHNAEKNFTVWLVIGSLGLLNHVVHDDPE